MKYKKVFIGGIVFFVLLNLSFFIEGLLGFLALPALLFMFSYFLILIGCFFYHAVYMIKERFRYKQRNIIVSLLFLIIGMTIYEPNGFLNYEVLNGKSILSASQEGAANCTVNLNLYPNNIFTCTDICFGVHTVIGKYEIEKDTIFFNNIYVNMREKFFDYAVYSPEECYFSNGKKGIIKLYKNKSDSITSYQLCITNKEIFL